MTAAQIKKALRELGVQVITEKVPGVGGGYDYLIQSAGTDATLGSGWSLGSRTDALHAAYHQAKDIVRRLGTPLAR